MELLGPDGFRVVRGMLSPDEVAGIAAAFEGLEAIARVLPGTSDVGDARFFMRAEPFRLDRVVWCGGAAPALLRWGADARFVDLACEALRSEAVDQILQQAHFKLPGDGVGFGWHQDASNRRYGSPLWRDSHGDGAFVQILLAVDPAGPGNGGLSVIPGSQRLGFVADPQTGELPPGLVHEESAMTPTLDPGDALLFGAFLIHGSSPNEGDSPRRTLIQGYAAPGANGRVYPGCGLGVLRRATWAARRSA